MAGLEVIRAKETYTWKIFIMRVAAVSGMLTSAFGAYFSVFAIEIPVVRAVFLSIFISMVAVFCCRKGRLWWLRLSVLSLLSGLILYLYRRRILGGLTAYVNPYVERLNVFYYMNLQPMAAEPDSQATFVILLFLFLLAALLLCLVLEKKNGKLAAVLILLFPVILLAIIGEMPALSWCWCMIASMTFYQLVGNMTVRRIPVKEFLAASVVLVILWISSLAFTPVIHIYKEAHIDDYKKVKTAIIDSQQIDWKEISARFVPDDENFGGSREMDGQLKDLTGFYHTGRKIKEIVLEEKPTESVYQREFIGAYYTGEAWLPPENDAFSLDLYIDGYKDEKLEQLKWIGESMVQSSPEQVATVINRLCSAENGFRYEQYPGKMPEDRGFVEGFLFVKKAGFCVHYATAATMIYRLCGWPARYVEGYRIEPEEFELQEDGRYKAVVTDYMGHAWCETYEGSAGWRIREHTISVPAHESAVTPTPTVTGDLQEQNREDLQADDAQEQKQEDLEKMPSAEQDLPHRSSLNGKEADVTFFVGIGLFAGAVLVIFLQQRLRRTRKMASFRIRKGNQGILNLYNEIMAVCEYADKDIRSESERQRAVCLSEKFTQLSKDEWIWLYECAERAAYGSELLSREERREMKRLYQRLRNAVVTELSVPSRLWFLYGRAL